MEICEESIWHYMKHIRLQLQLVGCGMIGEDSLIYLFTRTSPSAESPTVASLIHAWPNQPNFCAQIFYETKTTLQNIIQKVNKNKKYVTLFFVWTAEAGNLDFTSKLQVPYTNKMLYFELRLERERSILL